MSTTVRPITKFEFAKMWGGVDFEPELAAMLERRIELTRAVVEGQPPSVAEEYRWLTIDFLTEGPLYHAANTED